jgi:hypothetical protein
MLLHIVQQVCEQIMEQVEERLVVTEDRFVTVKILDLPQKPVGTNC